MKKRIVSLLLVLCMIFTLVPAYALTDGEKTAGTAAGQTQTAAPSGGQESPFADVKPGDWCYEAVLYARANGFFNGTTPTTFEPNGTLTRGMFVTVLGRMAGADASAYQGDTGFTDVKAGSYCAPYVKWAAKHGITGGTGNGAFSPNAPVTRQQMAAFLVRYFETFSVQYETGADVATQPADLAAVAGYAKDAVLKLWKQGLLNGDGVNFNPAGNATRAQTAAVCMRTDKTVDTWYSEPGVPSARVSVDPAAAGTGTPEQKPAAGGSSSSGGSSGGGGGGGTVTSHYQVTFALGDGMSAEGVTLPQSKTYAKDTKLSGLPAPYLKSGLFAGWYYDAALTKAVGAEDTLTRNLTLYAKLDNSGAAAQVGQIVTEEVPNYVTVTVKSGEVSGWTFRIENYQEGCIESFVNLTAGNADVVFTVDNGGTVRFQPEQGQTYRVELAEDSAACFVADGLQPQSVRVLNIITEKGQVDNLKLDGGLKFIPRGDVGNMAALDGLFTAALAENGKTTQIQKVSKTGTFTYTGSEKLSVGDTAAIYEGLRPDLRKDSTLNTADDGSIAYVEITGVSGDTYTYKTADTEDVLFTPDVLPVSADADKDKTDGNILTVDKDVMEFTDDKYAAMGLDSQTTVDVGDFLALYTGTLGGDAGQESGLTAVYGQITGVSFNEETEEYTIAYTPVEESAIHAAMDVYQTREEKAPELTARQIRSMEADMERQALESGFAEQAAQYLAGLAVETDGFRELSDDLDMDLASYSLTYADGTPVQQGDMALMASGNRVLFDKDKLKVEAQINAGSLTHFDGSYGLRAELTVSFTVEIESKLHAGDKLVIEVKAVFEQEILLSVNTSGGAIWKKAWIFPYIADYQLNANLDLGTYTGVGVTATARTAAEEDDEDPFKDVTGEGAAGKVKNIGQQILQLMEDKEHFLGEDLEMSTVGGGLADKYSSMMEDAEENWIELFRKEIYSKEGPVDRLHILVYGISADFVVSASLYVTLGMSFEYEAAKRYTFSIKLFSRDVTSGAVDLVTPHYNFDFYVMGTAGIRAGVEFEVGVGLFSLKLDSIGITAEAGVYARMWGYFYYHLEWTKGQDKKSEASGALFVEIGMYLLVTFKAQLFSSDKLTYQPTLYENEWPLWSAGAQKNVYDFAYDDDDPQLNVEMQSVRTAALPSSLFDMNYMDMKTGDLYGTDADDEDENPAGNFDDASESNYIVELSDPDKFHYDPAANTITVTPGSGSVSESCEMKLTWKNGRLAFTSKPIERTVTIEWTDPANARFIAFNSKGGSMVKTIATTTGETVVKPDDPTKVGYIFAGWYEDESRTKPFAFPSTMPDYWAESGEQYKGVTVYAKWTPRTDTKYTVEYYLQNLNGTYTLQETADRTGTTEAQTVVDEKAYAHYTAKPVTTKPIAPDGSTVVRVYYTRDKYTFTFKRTADAPESEWLTVTGRYGATVYAPKFARDGYDFDGFDGLRPDAYGNYVIEDVSAGKTYTAQWTPRNDIAYRVEHYVQRIGGDGWLLYDGEGAVVHRYDGTADEPVSITPIRLDVSGLNYAGSNADDGELTFSPDGKTVVKLFYKRSSYTVTLDPNGGALTGAAAQTRVYGEKLSAINEPTRPGYAFAGWYTAKDETGAPYDFSKGVTGDLTLYARWTANGDTAYTVEHYQQNADGTYPDKPTETESLTGATDAQATAVERSYDHFTLNEETSSKTGTVTADGKLVLKLYYDRAEYTATFEQDGTELKTETARWGAPITPPTEKAAVPDGYTLSWSPVLSDPPVMPAEDTVYTAVLTAKGNITYTVNHYQQNADDDGYTLADTDSLTGATDAQATAVERSYDHFTLNAEKSVKTGTITADGKLTLDLYYDRDTVTVTFDPNGGALGGESGSVEKTLRWGASLGTVTPEREDYAFDGWYTADNAKVTVVSGEAVTLTARWTAGAVSFTVQHYIMNTDGVGYELRATDNTAQGAVDSTVTLNTLKDAGYEVENGIAYDHASVGGSAASVTETTVVKDMTVKLYYDRKAFTVTFDPKKGTLDSLSDPNARTLYYGAPLASVVPERTDYTFTGWHTDEACTEKLDTVPAQAESALMLYAGWEANEVEITLKHYVLRTNGYGMEKNPQLTETKTARAGEIIDDLKGFLASDKVATADGGIYYMSTCREGSTSPSANIRIETGLVLEVNYGRVKSNLTWNYDSSVCTASGAWVSGTVYYGEEIKAPTLTREGYTYSWTPEPQTLVELEDLTYDIEWKPNPYTVSFNANGGSGTMDDQSFVYDTAQALTENAFTRSGYAFTGWSTAAEGGESADAYADGASVKNLTAAENGKVTLYAQWSKAEYTISYKNADGTDFTDWAAGAVYSQSYGVDSGTVTLPTEDDVTAPAGQLFDGWYTDAEYTDGPVTSFPAADAANKVFYVKWKTDEPVIEYLVAEEGHSLRNLADLPTTYTVGMELPDGQMTYAKLSDNFKDNFLYWYIAGSPETPVWKVPEGTVGKLTLYARYLPAEEIATAADLYALQARYNQKGVPEWQYFNLVADIELEDGWKAIGGSDPDKNIFNDIFNGNNHTITMHGTSQPLFNYNLGIIRDLTVILDNVTGDHINGAWGAVAAQNGHSSQTLVSKKATITNCTVYGDVSVNPKGGQTDSEEWDKSRSAVYVGGIVGYNNEYGIVKYCQAGLGKGDTPTPLQLKLVGSTSTQRTVGGLVGQSRNRLVQCPADDPRYHRVEIESDATYIGGLVGQMYGGAGSENSQYFEFVSSTLDVTIRGTKSKDVAIGGVIGAIAVYEYNSVIVNAFGSKVTCDLSGAGSNYKFGGFAGQIRFTGTTPGELVFFQGGALSLETEIDQQYWNHITGTISTLGCTDAVAGKFCGAGIEDSTFVQQGKYDILWKYGKEDNDGPGGAAGVLITGNE